MVMICIVITDPMYELSQYSSSYRTELYEAIPYPAGIGWFKEGLESDFLGLRNPLHPEYGGEGAVCVCGSLWGTVGVS